MHQDIDKVALAVHGIVAGFAGIVRALNEHKTKVFEILSSMVISGFTGLIFGMLAMYYCGENSYLTLSIAGVGGLMGEKGIYYLIEIVKKTIKANIR